LVLEAAYYLRMIIVRMIIVFQEWRLSEIS